MSNQTLDHRSTTVRSRKLTSIIILELIVGGIIFLGGIALTAFATNKAVGIIHTGLGLFAFPVAYGLWKRDAWAWNASLVLNLASIAYNTVSESIVVGGVLLPPAALQDSIIGTIVAVTISIAIIILLVISGKDNCSAENHGASVSPCALND